MAGWSEPPQDEPARRKMIERDLTQRGITDRRVLAAMASVPRDRFVGQELSEHAYADRPLPIGLGQTISQPLMVALMLQALELRATDRVLEVGTGSGYAAAVASRLAGYVHGVERLVRLAGTAAARLRELDYGNVRVHVGDGRLGWPAAAPYDAILVSAAGRELPTALADQLVEGGRLVVPLGPSGEQRLVRMRRLAADEWQSEDLGGVRFVPLLSGVEGEDATS
ncbi:MAG: protein-L-isoaspartate(D-aspartate) O-methyltransferase [Acidimicrobiia bacterium]|nr:protein-L-isoaspartate(D-aspartate) O-methyltransferase [Acidimicrobiia bacterium]